MDWVDIARRWVPRKMRFALQRFISLREVKLRWRERNNPLAHILSGDDNQAGSPVRFGIVRNAAHSHSHFVGACQELGVPFRVLDLYRSDWLELVKASDCQILLAWPDGFLDSWNAMIKDRVEVLERDLGLVSIPSSRELWLYEDKRRTAYWLAANEFPHPRTWIFYDREEADRFVGSCDLPIVFKTSFGAGACGVMIVRSRRKLRGLVRRAFTKGISPGGTDYRDRQWGNILLQEYLPDVREWRMVRIGDAFFGHPKGRVGDFHSGSGKVLWGEPGSQHMDLLFEITERGQFRSMCVDVFETLDGRLLVNELQAVFGASYSVDQLRVNGVAGRFVREHGRWVFEAGDFARNACANERVRDALKRVMQDVTSAEAERDTAGTAASPESR